MSNVGTQMNYQKKKKYSILEFVNYSANSLIIFEENHIALKLMFKVVFTKINVRKLTEVNKKTVSFI